MTVAVIEFAPWPSRRRLYSRKYLSLLLLIPSGIMFLAHGLSAQDVYKRQPYNLLNAGGFLHCPDWPRVPRYQGIDGQQRYTLNRRLRH